MCLLSPTVFDLVVLAVDCQSSYNPVWLTGLIYEYQIFRTTTKGVDRDNCLYNCMMANASATQQAAANTTHQPSCRSQVRKRHTKHYLLTKSNEYFLENKVIRMDHQQKKDKTERATGLGRKTREGIDNGTREGIVNGTREGIENGTREGID